MFKRLLGMVMLCFVLPVTIAHAADGNNTKTLFRAKYL